MEGLKLHKVLTPLDEWSYSFGCLLGWGGFVMPLTVFLPQSGLMGSLLGFAVGGFFIAMIALNYHYLSMQCKGNGGIFYLLYNTMGRGHAYAAAWGISFAHLLIIPLNARAFVRMLHALLEEYTGIEIDHMLPGLHILTFDLVVIVGVLAIFSRLNSRGIKWGARFQTVFALVMLVGITTLLVMMLCSGVDVSARMRPAYAPGANSFRSFMLMFIMIPWAFVGFDSVPSLSREANFSKNKLGKIMILAVIAGTFGYMANIVITVLGGPTGWVEYAGHAGSGLERISVVASARRYYGRLGTNIALITLIAAIMTGINGSIANVSRLFYTMSRANLFFQPFGITNKKGVPIYAINLSVIASIILVLIAKTFNTMEMVASLCTAFGYGYCSLSALLRSARNRAYGYTLAASLGLAACGVWFAFLLIPVLGTEEVSNPHMYGSLAVWIFIGIAGYAISNRDNDALFDIETV